MAQLEYRLGGGSWGQRAWEVFGPVTKLSAALLAAGSIAVLASSGESADCSVPEPAPAPAPRAEAFPPIAEDPLRAAVERGLDQHYANLAQPALATTIER